MEVFEKLNEPVIIKNNDFEKCFLFISFPISDVDEVKLRVLRSIVFNKSNTYDTDRKVYEISVNNYCISYKGNIVSIGNSYFLELSLYFPCEKAIGEDVLEKNLLFIKDIIYNPYTENGVFSSKEVMDVKNIIKNNIERKFKNALWYYGYKSDLIIDEDNYLCDDVVSDLSLLDTVNEKNLYEYYNKIISNPPLIYLIGNVDKQKASTSIKKILLDDKLEMVKFDKEYNHFIKKMSNEVVITNENTNFKSSGLYITYKIKNMQSEKDSMMLILIRDLLNSSSSDILFNNLRIKNNLVYRCGAYCYSSFGSLTLWASTDKENIDACIKSMKEVMKKIRDVDFISEKVKLILDDAKLDDILAKENINSILMKEVDKYIDYRKTSFYETLKDISAHEIIKFMDRMVLTNEYIGIGDGNE